MRISFFFLLLAFTVSGFGQDTVNITDSRGHRQGFWRKNDSSGHVIYEGHFRDGVPSGVFRYFYPDGKLKTLSTLSNQGKRAVTVSYFPNGTKMAEGNYLDEKKDSTWQFFSEYSGALVSRETYLSGQIHGFSKVFYEEGGLSEQQEYKNGAKDGPWEQHYPDGKPKLLGTYKDGKLNGLLKTLYKSGQIMYTGIYVDGYKDKTWLYYNEKGAVTKKEIYRGGKLIKVDPEVKEPLPVVPEGQ
ncbi:MAG: toxin-antitoxin system YwqK family antitoxin [bacterium]